MIDSPYSSRVGTAYVPTDEEIVQVKEILSEPLNKLAQLEAELAKLDKQREELTQEIEGHRAFISLSRRLPEDILREIFACCLPGNHEAIMDKSEAPILLTHICSRWRQIALTTPTLWATIHIPVPRFPSVLYDLSFHNTQYGTRSQELVHKRAAGVREWLERSKGCPLSISFCDWDTSGSVNEYCDLLLSAMQPFSSRWKRLDITASDSHLSQITSLSASEIPWLEFLHITPIRKLDEDFFPHDSIPWGNGHLFKSARLRQLSFSRIDSVICSFAINWSNLTHLSIQETNGLHSINDIAWILRSCSQLIMFYMAYMPTAQNSIPHLVPQDPSKISLPSLRTFSIIEHRMSLNYGSPFIENVDVPSLQDLVYHFPTYPFQTSPLPSWFRTTENSIRSLNTDPQLFSREEFLSCLKLCPCLTTLILHTIGLYAPPPPEGDQSMVIDDDFLQLLSRPDDQGQYLCPELERFECSLSRPQGVQITDETLLSFIKNKQDGILSGLRKLKRLAITLGRRQTVPLAKQLEPYSDAGLDVELCFEGSPPDTIREELSAYSHLPESRRSFFRIPRPAFSMYCHAIVF